MKIKKLNLKNVRCFKEYNLDFTTDDNETLNHIVLVGRNGTGKSTILRALVEILVKLYSFSNMELLNDSRDNYFSDKDIYFDEKNLEIYADFELDENETKKMGRSNFAVRYCYWEKSLEWPASFLYLEGCPNYETYSNEFQIFVELIKSGKALYFDAFRYMSSENPLGPNMQEATNPYLSLLKSNIDVHGRTTKRDMELKQWIVNTDYMRLKKTSERYEILYAHLVKAFDLLLHPLKFECINEEGEIIFKDETNEQSISVNLLSDGFKSIFQIVIATMRMLFENSTENELFYLKSGMIIVDEIDCHIHPRWQKSIMPAMTELFPNCQFIVTTHSPYIIESVQDYEIIRVGDKPIV